MGTRIIECCLCRGVLLSPVFAIKIIILQLGSAGKSIFFSSLIYQFYSNLRPAPVIHHFRPLITYSFPSRFASQLILVASEEAYNVY